VAWAFGPRMRMKVPVRVMLSAAKHLLFDIENKEKQIPRSARDDIAGGFFDNLLGIGATLRRGNEVRSDL